MDQGEDIESIFIIVNKKARPQRVQAAESLAILYLGQGGDKVYFIW